MNMKWENKIREILSGDLPGEVSHRKMLPPGRKYSLPQEHQITRNSGILLLVFPEGNEIYTCLIRRPSYMKHHAGQIGFPGGQMEEPDATLLETALRETREEIGIDTDPLEVLGSLTPLYIQISNFFIFPFVAWTDQKPDFNVNTDEVEKLILFPFIRHLNASEWKEAEVDSSTGKLWVPSFNWEGNEIWGATAMILAEFLDLLAQNLSLNNEVHPGWHRTS